MREAWKRETYVRSQSFSSESAVKYLHDGRRKIQISPPPGEQDQLNALPQGQQRQSNPHPMPSPPPPRRLYIDRCITTILRVVSHFNLSVLANETLSLVSVVKLTTFLAPYEHVLITCCLNLQVFRGNVFYF